MAEISSPFGGITRIRFKGFDRHFSPIISARRLPRSIEIKSRDSEVNPPRTGSLREQSRQIRAKTPAEELVPPVLKFSLALVMTNEMQIRQSGLTNLNPLLARRIRPAAICFPGDNPQPALGAFYLPRPDSFRSQHQLPGQDLRANLSWQSIGFHHAPSGNRLR